MRDFLPQAEAELKFRALPDDEMAIVQLIEKHEVNHEHEDIIIILLYPKTTSISI
jgi:uncharacterized membrane protein